ncbi:MAG: hypothetical protein QNJ37_24260 [Crocosphaera sp.]|nr:hypothetical protein [Crocosphaera sp.]
MKESFLPQLLEPLDGLKLRQGVLLDKRITPEMFSFENLINASEVLIEINESRNLSSQAELLSRALSFGWTPLEFEEKPFSKEKISKFNNSSKVNLKYYILKGISLIIGLVYLPLFPTTVGYLLSFTFLICLLPIYPMLLLSNRDILQQTWTFLKVLRFEPDYVIEIKKTLYHYFDYIFSASEDQNWNYLNVLLSQAFVADQILLLFLVTLAFGFCFVSMFLASMRLKEQSEFFFSRVGYFT